MPPPSIRSWPRFWVSILAVVHPLGLLALALLTGTASSAPSSRLPGRLETYVSEVLHLTTDERRILSAGGPITRLLEGDPSREVGVFGAVWVEAPINGYVDAVADIERFGSGGPLRVTKRIGAPARRSSPATCRRCAGS